MTTFELIKQIPCSADAVFEELCHMERYVESMKNIERLTVLSRAEHMAQTRWDAALDGRKLTWTEEDMYDQEARRIEYRLIEGDFSEMTGNWQVEDTADGCTVTLNVSFAFGIPMLAMFVEPILKRKLEENSHMLLDGIETYLNTK
ncbi:MAG: SRPBCC family protein [Selenomonadales bacterium]|nr:SRPBCC family protein [Selenomonadales bacterium]